MVQGVISIYTVLIYIDFYCFNWVLLRRDGFGFFGLKYYLYFKT